MTAQPERTEEQPACRSAVGTPAMPSELWDRLYLANGNRRPSRRQKLLACRNDLLGRLASLDGHLEDIHEAQRWNAARVAEAVNASPLKIASTADPVLAHPLRAHALALQTARECRLAVTALEAELVAVETLLSQEKTP